MYTLKLLIEFQIQINTQRAEFQEEYQEELDRAIQTIKTLRMAGKPVEVDAVLIEAYHHAFYGWLESGPRNYLPDADHGLGYVDGGVKVYHPQYDRIPF